ncbi:hypothetical protein GQ600_4894 [Phytophthora cactorum]|nr:hypothetical protein GQ600_4894 [Phytophthora cactorum]
MIKDGDSPDTVNGFQADGGRRLRGKDSVLSFIAKEFKGNFFWTKTYKQNQILKHNARVDRQMSNIKHSMIN